MMCWGSAPNPAEDAALGTRKGLTPLNPLVGEYCLIERGLRLSLFCLTVTSGFPRDNVPWAGQGQCPCGV